MEQSSQKMDDNQMEVKGLPEDKNREQVSPKHRDIGSKNKIIKKTGEKETNIRRIIHPKKTRITKEIVEMTRSGLINMINFPIIDRREGIYMKEYRRSFMKTVSYTHLLRREIIAQKDQ